MSTPEAPVEPPRPDVAPPAPWSFPTPQTAALPGGARVIWYDVPGQHVWSVRVGIPAPLAGEPRTIEGVGTLMARLLDEGSTEHDTEEMAELIERRGVAIGAGVGERGLVVELEVTRRYLSEALDLLAEVVVRPAFPEAQVRRHVRTRLTEIEHDFHHPGQRAAIAFAQAFYPEQDRLSRPTGGTPESVAALTREDLAAYHRRVVSPAGATVVVVGDIGGLDVPAEVARAFAGWEGCPAAPVGAAPAPRPDASRIVVVDRPGSVQSELYVGCAGPGRAVAGGWAPYPVLGYLLGGSPQARLDAVLREDKGYTYGMRAGFRPRRDGGLFLASGSVRTEVTADALRLTLDILDAGRDGFTDREVAEGVDFLRQTAPGRFATAEDVADEAIARAMEGLTTGHTTQVLHDMAALTPKSLRRAYRDWVDGAWTSVIVGDAAAIADDLAALGRGEVQVLPG